MGHDFGAEREKRGAIASQNKATDDSITQEAPPREVRGRALRHSNAKARSRLMSCPRTGPVLSKDVSVTKAGRSLWP